MRGFEPGAGAGAGAMGKGISRATLPSACLAVFALLLYANSLANGLVLDDNVAIVANSWIRDLANVPALFAADYWEPAFKDGLYRPLVTTSYALNHALGGTGPFGYHAVNVALHALVCVLVLALYRRLGDDAPVAVAAAFIFAAHAIHTEAVANVVGRAELMSAAFFLGALLAYIGSRSGPAPRARRLLAASFGLFALALLSKENAITLLGVVPLYDLAYGDLRRGPGHLLRRRWRAYAGFALVAAAYAVVRTRAIALEEPLVISGLDNPLVMLDQPWRLVNALQVAVRCLWLLLFPLRLCYDYSFDAIDLITSAADLRWVPVLAVAAAVLGSLLLAWRASRPLFFALGFSLVTWSLVSNLVVPIGTILGERLLYLPSVGFCLAAAIALRGALSRLALPRARADVLLLGVFAVAVGLHGWRTLQRNADWKTDTTLFLKDLEVNPGSAKVQYNASLVFLATEGDHERAEAHARRTLEIWPHHRRGRVALGHAILRAGRTEEAMAVYEEVVKSSYRDARVFNNLGFLLLESGGDMARGLELIERAVALEPENPHYLDSLGWGYYQTGRLDEARERIARSLEIDAAGESGAKRREHLEAVERALRERAGAAGRP